MHLKKKRQNISKFSSKRQKPCADITGHCARTRNARTRISRQTCAGTEVHAFGVAIFILTADERRYFRPNTRYETPASRMAVVAALPTAVCGITRCLITLQFIPAVLKFQSFLLPARHKRRQINKNGIAKINRTTKI